MTIPLMILGVVYLVACLIFIFFAFFNIYHLVRFGFLSWPNVVVICLFALGSLVIMVATWYAIYWAVQHPLLPVGSFPNTF